MIIDTLGCEWGATTFLIFSSNVFGALVYYSHLFSLITALGLGIFVYAKNPRSLISELFLALTLVFSLWVFSDTVLWADANPSHIMFFWSLTILLEPVIYVLGLYFLAVYIKNDDISNRFKFLLISLLLPTILLVPTKLGILGFDYTNCDREVIEGLLVYYGYFVEVIISLSAVIYSIRSYQKVSKEKKKPLVFMSLGMVLFFFMFAWGNIVGSISEDWTLGQYGLFGMPILLAFFTYTIVRFKTFNIKLIGTQALVVVLWVTLSAILFVRKIEDVRVIVALTLILFLIVGILLVRSVKREVEQREHIEKLAGDLERANEKLKELDQLKSEFLSLATHQIRAPLTAIKGYSSMLLEGNFGVLPQKATDSIQTIMKSCQNLINIVADFLNISRIEQGRMVYEKSIFNLAELAKEVLNEIKPNIDKAGLILETKMPLEEIKVNADRGKIKQVVENIVDNAIKYTVHGGINVSVFADKETAKVTVKDSGVGIDPNEMNKLFNKFSRTKDASKISVTGTGLGLYIAKKMTEAHSGDIKVFSEGIGKGTTFTIELPITK